MVEWAGFLTALAELAGQPSPSTPAERLIFTSLQQVLLASQNEPTTGPPARPDDESTARLIGAGRDLAEQLRGEGQSLAVALAAQTRVREELLALCFRSFADPKQLHEAVTIVLGLADGLFSGMVSEWLRLQTMLHRRRHKEARRYILREKKRYDTVFRRMNEPAFIVDGEMQLVDVNPAFEKFFGMSGRECVGSTCMTIIGRGSCPTCLLPEVILAGGSFSDVEVSLDLSCPGQEDGCQVRTVRLAGTSLGTEGEGAGAIVILQNITAQKHAEAELKRSEEKFHSLVENLPDLIWRADRRGRLLFVSSNSARILGLGADDLLDTDRFARIHSEDLDGVRDAYALLWESGRAFDVQYRFRRGDGTWIWLHDRAIAIGEDQGRPFADGLSWEVTDFKNVQEELDEYRCWLEDLVDERTEELRRINKKLKSEIVERKLVQKELLHMTASLRRSNADLEQFAYVASHDLREPLMLVTAFAERLLKHYGSGLDERGREYVTRIIRSAGTLRELVEALLQLSRVSTSTRPFEPLDLNLLLLDVLEGLEELIAQSGARVEVGPLPALYGDPVLIRQLFQNLISNALKYRQPELVPLVTINGRRLEDGYCEITVADNGIGMAEKDLERIFEPFVRLQGREVCDGCGMGLATCRKIVDRHRGEIKAWSQPGHGSVILVKLPVRQPGRE
jgi:PAS domain S-box-containing protein